MLMKTRRKYKTKVVYTDQEMAGTGIFVTDLEGNKLIGYAQVFIDPPSNDILIKKYMISHGLDSDNILIYRSHDARLNRGMLQGVMFKGIINKGSFSSYPFISKIELTEDYVDNGDKKVYEFGFTKAFDFMFEGRRVRRWSWNEGWDYMTIKDKAIVLYHDDGTMSNVTLMDAEDILAHNWVELEGDDG